MTQFICKGVKQISLNMTFTFTIRISRRFSSAWEFQMGEFPEILIAKCRSRFYCTWFFSLAEDFESWREGRKGLSKSGEKCSRWKVHMYTCVYNMKPARPWIVHLKIIWQLHAHPVHKKLSRFSYVRYHWNLEPVCNKSHFVSLFYLYWYFKIY
jgi:hypothetical protein